MYLASNLANLNTIKQAFNIFATTMEAKINWHKSNIIWISKNSKSFNWWNKNDLKWLKLREMIQYVKFMIGFESQKKDILSNFKDL